VEASPQFRQRRTLGTELYGIVFEREGDDIPGVQAEMASQLCWQDNPTGGIDFPVKGHCWLPLCSGR
jgi:hypothetical protein